MPAYKNVSTKEGSLLGSGYSLTNLEDLMFPIVFFFCCNPMLFAIFKVHSTYFVKM
jgi:hypothetical protein